MCQYTNIHDVTRAYEYFVTQRGPLYPGLTKGTPLLYLCLKERGFTWQK